MLVRFDVGHYRLDKAPDVDAAACAVCTDERPLRGPAGLADWRLSGLLSRQLQLQRYEGRLGEDMMVATGDRLPFGRVFLVGLGRSSDVDGSMARQITARTGNTLVRAGVGAAVLGLWDLTRERIPFEEALEAFLQGCSRAVVAGASQETFDVHLLSRSSTETGRMTHHLDQRYTGENPAGIELFQLRPKP